MPPTDPRPDEELIAAANAGEVAAFEALYWRYRDWVVRLAYRFTRNQADALDVLQDTFLYLLGRFPGLVLTARLTTLLYPAVKNLSLACRHRKLRACGAQWSAALEHDADPAPPLRAATTGCGSSPHDELADVLRDLAEAHREVVLMRYVDDLTLAEIATALSIPLGTVKSRLHAALHALRADPRTKAYFA